MREHRGTAPWLRIAAALARDRVLLGLGGATTAMMIWYATNAGTRSAQVIGAWTFIATIHLCLIAVARAIVTTPDLTPPYRRFWRAVAIAGVIYLAGDLAQVVTAIRNPLAGASVTDGPIQITTLSLGSAWLGVALLMSPLGFESRRERVRFWMDVATVMVAAAVVGWYLIAPDRPGAVLDAAAPVLMGPVILLLCVFVVAKLTMSGTAPFTRATAVFGTAASAFKSGADAIGADGLGPERLHWFLCATVASHALLTIAVRVNHVQVAENPALLKVRRRRPYSLLPYGAIAVTYLLLTIAVVRGENTTIAIALGGAVVSTTLVVIRQLAAFQENARLLGELDTKVNELHATQEGLRKSLAERDTLAARLRHQAFHDGLTGLPNRTLYTERVDAALAKATQTGGQVAVMLIDLDDFKLVNDAYGHAAGDALLRVVAERLSACVRAGDTLSRIGGDEFAVLLRPGPNDDARDIAARIVAAVEAPVPVDGGSARVGASIGIALSTAASRSAAAVLAAPISPAAPSYAAAPASPEAPDSPAAPASPARPGEIALTDGLLSADGSARADGLASRDGSVAWLPDGEALLREADHAMYEVKRAGKGSFAVALTAPRA